MKTIPLLLVALLTLWYSAVGAEITWIMVWSTGAMLFSFAAVFLPWPHRRPLTSPSTAPRLKRGWLPGWLPGLLVICLCFLLHWSILTTQWPLHMTFELSRPALEKMAESLREGVKIEGPQRAGFFIIRKADIEQYPGTVCLWTDLEPNGRMGFLDVPPYGAALPWAWSEVRLNDRWRFLKED